jgi:hypothetical protein
MAVTSILNFLSCSAISFIFPGCSMVLTFHVAIVKSCFLFLHFPGLNPRVPSKFRGRLLGFVALSFSMLESLAPRKTPNLEDQASVFISPRDRVAQSYSQAPGTYFSPLLQHAWATLRLFLIPGHHTEI